jgi:hypothetical protein
MVIDTQVDLTTTSNTVRDTINGLVLETNTTECGSMVLSTAWVSWTLIMALDTKVNGLKT